ncbi:DNA gyrase/topoisomerase IV subunit B [Humisphaera borealis]|uniref:DNA topoisomerase (ATP-hydrolyzing) n=1 Tax=Humisphaera borealis TaxID=2807512 RepID=A0A7M2WUQ3_9BACT|nr:DNA topoisomerase IV subunit B [Humisphaera borealis]QOV89169.1 type IIA DNA topoisomerase subunit B [Humisphaera borealis]
MTTTAYNASSITVLEGLDPVRKRPGMYIGGTGSSGLHHLVWEIFDNSVDEAMNGHADQIEVTLHKDGASITVSDNGRGIPVDNHPTHKKPALEIILCTLHAGGKFDNSSKGNYKTSGGLHGVGASVVNALSKKLVATIKRDGAEWQMEFSGGKATGKLKKLGPARGTGTQIFFHPDPQIFPRTEFNGDTIRERLEVASYIHKGLKVIWIDETKGKREVFHHEDGILAFMRKIVGEKNAKPVHEQPFILEKQNGIRMEMCFAWTESTEELVKSYANGIPTSNGGTHENGLRAGVLKAIRNFIETHNLTPRGVTLAAEDIREGVIGVLSVFVEDPQFQGQTKERLNNPEVQSIVDGAVRPVLEQWLNNNRTVAETIINRIIIAARAREASRAASASISRKTATGGRLNLPGKLADCSSSNRAESELFIVEGDSAGGSAKQGRDRNLQAILPLRGKVLNTEGTSLAKVLENREIADLVTALGCGAGMECDPTKLRYQRLILLADADSDGHHITTLLLTFVYRHMRQLIDAGRVFIALPPLYRVDIGKETHWAADDADKARILAKHAKSNSKTEITRFKGLGEMMPKVLWETTLNPKTRRLLRVEISDALATDRVINELMGKDASARFRFIMERAEEADELDV